MTRKIDPTTEYIDSYLPQTEASIQARVASRDLGLEPITPGVAQVITLLTRLMEATSIVEVGTGAGTSALAFFAGMPNDGVLTTIDSEPEHQMSAREAMKTAGIRHQRYRAIAGDALSVLSKLADAAYDIAFVDGAFLEYPEYLDESLRIVRPGGMVILNHALLHGTVADPTNFDDDTMIVRDAVEAARTLDGVTVSLLPVGDGLLLILKDRQD